MTNALQLAQTELFCDSWTHACTRVRAPSEHLTGRKGLREFEGTLELRVHECVRHSSDSQARRALGSRRPHSNRVSTSACDTRLNCIVVMSHILVWHYPPLVRSQRSNRVRHSNHSQARRALGSRRPHSNRVSTSACDIRTTHRPEGP